jgi:hypothetical protein
MPTDLWPPYDVQSLALLIPAQRKLLLDTIAVCLRDVDALRGILTAPQPDPDQYVTARRQLTSSISVLAHLVGDVAVPAALVGMTRLRLNREVELPAGGCMNYSPTADWEKLVVDTALQACSDLERLRAAAAALFPKPKKPRKLTAPRVVPLTEKQTEAMLLVSEHKGNYAAAARAGGKSRQQMTKLYKKGCKKLGLRAVEKPKTKALPLDRRGQATIPDTNTPDPADGE